MKKVRNALVVADHHGYNYAPKVLSIQCKIARIIKPDYLVFLGDQIDATGISKFTAKEFSEGALDTVNEIEFFRNKIFNPLVEASPRAKIIWTRGNHDGKRFVDFLLKLKEKGFLEQFNHYNNLLNIKKQFPEVDVYDYNQCARIGRLYFTHGEYHNMHHTHKHAIVYGKNVMYGHLHTHDEKTVISKATNKIHAGISIPCSCKLDMEYIKNRSHSWVQGCAVVQFTPSGDYFHHVIKIINNRTIFRGRVITP